MIKSHRLALKSHRNVNLRDKRSPYSEKSHKTINLCNKKSQTSEKSHETVNFYYIMSQTYGMNYAARQKLVNLNCQINKVIVKITKSMYLGQDVGDGLQPNHYHCVEIHRSAAQFGYIQHEIGNRICGCQ